MSHGAINPLLAECGGRKGTPFARGEQDVAAQSLEFADYVGYLSSKLWKRIKRRVLKRDGRTCRCCGGAANLVHHRTYTREVLAGEDDEQLFSICEGCHDHIHWDDLGVWRTAEESSQLLLERRGDNGFPEPKYYLRRDRAERPPEWPRMSALQRTAWEKEEDRQRCLRKLKKYKGNAGWTALLRLLLHEMHGMDDVAIDTALRSRLRGRPRAVSA
jgi:hypothetical protein